MIIDLRILAGILIVSVVSVGVILHDNSPDVFVLEGTDNVYMELDNGNFNQVSPNGTISGTYTLEGNTLTLSWLFGSWSMEYHKTYLIDKDGDKWFK